MRARDVGGTEPRQCLTGTPAAAFAGQWPVTVAGTRRWISVVTVTAEPPPLGRVGG
jgi:hypothetical protein